jgi:hypothetical protein
MCHFFDCADLSIQQLLPDIVGIAKGKKCMDLVFLRPGLTNLSCCSIQSSTRSPERGLFVFSEKNAQTDSFRRSVHEDYETTT